MRQYLYNYIIILLSIMHCTLLSGCWDYMDLDKRGYILGVGIDKADPTQFGNQFIYAPMESGPPKYAYTVQVPIIARAQSRPSGQGGGSSSRDKTWLIEMYGNSFFEVNREYVTRLDYPPFYAHLQAIVINETVAREGITAPLDLFIRDAEIRRRTTIFITPSKATDVLKVSPKVDDYSGIYLNRLRTGSKRTSRILHKTDLGLVAQSLHTGSDFVVPRVIPDREEIKNAGAAVFKKDKMVGWLDEIKTAYLKWIRDAVKGGTVAVALDEEGKKSVTLEIKKVKTKMQPKVNGDKITIILNTTASFHIAEVTSDLIIDAYDTVFIKKVEKLAEIKIKEEIEKTIKYVQKEFGADVFEFHLALKRHEPDVWDNVKENWHDVFPSVKSEVQVKVKIDQIGLTK